MQFNNMNGFGGIVNGQRKDNEVPKLMEVVTKDNSKFVNGEEYVKLSAKDFHQGLLTGRFVLENLKTNRYTLTYSRLLDLRNTTKQLLEEMEKKEHFYISLNLIHQDHVKKCFERDYNQLLCTNQELLRVCEAKLTNGDFIVDDEFLLTMDAKSAFEQLVNVAKRELEEPSESEKKKRKETTEVEFCTCRRNGFYSGWKIIDGRHVCDFCNKIIQ